MYDFTTLHLQTNFSGRLNLVTYILSNMLIYSIVKIIALECSIIKYNYIWIVSAHMYRSSLFNYFERLFRQEPLFKHKLFQTKLEYLNSEGVSRIWLVALVFEQPINTILGSPSSVIFRNHVRRVGSRRGPRNNSCNVNITETLITSIIYGHYYKRSILTTTCYAKR